MGPAYFTIRKVKCIIKPIYSFCARRQYDSAGNCEANIHPQYVQFSALNYCSDGVQYTSCAGAIFRLARMFLERF